MKNNIYDLVASELILRAGGGSASGLGGGSPSLDITSDIISNEVRVGYNEDHSFTSSVENIPSGYAVSASSHVVSYPTATSTTGSSASVTGVVSVNVGSTEGNTFVVSSTVTLVNAGDSSQPDIVLTSTMTITAVLPLYYGVAAYTATPSTLLSLNETAYSNTSFILSETIFGRLYIGLPYSLTDLFSITDNNGMVITVDKFTKYDNTSESINYYILNHDTELTGLNSKKFTLNFS